MKTMTNARGLVLLAMWALCAVFSIWSPKAQAEPKLDEQGIVTKVSGTVDLEPATSGAVYVDFSKSPTMSAKVAEMLEKGGFKVTSKRGDAATTIQISGDLVLVGGPVYSKGLKVEIGDAMERALARGAPDGQGAGKQEAVADVSTLTVNALAFTKTVSPAMQALRLSRMADVLAEESGLKGWLNGKVAGDPRGFCLSRCEDWKKVKQAAYVSVVVQGGGLQQSIRVQSTAFSEVMAPDEVATVGLQTALMQIRTQEPKVITASR